MGLGKDETPVVPFEQEEEAKSIGHSVTLEEDTRDPQRLKKVLFQLSERVSKRMRKEGYFGKRITLTIRYGDFYTFTKQKTLQQETHSGNEIFRHSLDLFESLSHPKPIRLLGVTLSLLRKEGYQLNLFEKKDRKENLLKAMDRVNERFGEWTLTWAGLY